jgi:hypothetical protein
VYLKAPPRKGILFTKNAYCQSVDTYTDADSAKAIDDKRFTSGYFTVVGLKSYYMEKQKNKV